MARIPQSEIERLKTEIAVERLVEASGIALKKSGKDQIGHCPFHDDAEPSLVITAAKNLWHCFGCQMGGGPIDWVMKMQGVSFRHAVEILREGIPLRAARHVSQCAGKPRARLVRWSIDRLHFGTHRIKARRCAPGTNTGHARP